MRRFFIAAKMIENHDVLLTTCIEFTFETLRAVRREDTVFSLVYDLNEMEIHFTTNRESQRKTVNFASFDFSGNEPAKALNMQLAQAGDVYGSFELYTSELNKTVLQSFFRDPRLTEVFQWKITDDMLHYFAAYPDTFIKK